MRKKWQQGARPDLLLSGRWVTVVTCEAAVVMEVVVERIAPNSSHALDLQMSE